MMRLRQLLKRDDGFGVLETMIALGIVFVALIALMSTTVAALQDVGLSRQRQSATGIANQAIEQMRGLKWASVVKGMSSTDPGFLSDPSIVACASVYRFRSCSGEQLVYSPGLAVNPPLVPHISTIGPPAYASTFVERLYVTKPAGTDSYRVTVSVSWPDPLRRGASGSMEVQTLVYHPAGCVDPVTQPFAAPCNPFFYSTASSSGGRVEVAGTIDGASVSSVLSLPFVRSDAQEEQLGRAQGSVVSSSVSLSAGTEQTAGGETLAAFADDDPSTSPEPDEYDASSQTASPGASLAFTSSGGTTLTARHTGFAGDTSGAASAMRSGAPAPGGGVQTCPLAPALPDADGLLCASVRGQQAGALESSLDLNVLGERLGSASLARISGAPAPTSFSAGREAQQGADGRTALNASRTIGTVDLLGLPSDVVVPPAQWRGYLVRLTGYADSATSAAGTGTSDPTASVSSGTIQYWDGSGYRNATVGAIPESIDLGSLSVRGLVLGSPVEVTMSGTLTTGGATVSQTPVNAGPNATRTESQARIESPMLGTFTYTVSSATATIASLTITVDLGSIVARTAYQVGTGA